MAQVWLNLHFKFFIHYFYYCVHHVFFVGIILISCSVFLWYRTGVTKNIRTKSYVWQNPDMFLIWSFPSFPLPTQILHCWGFVMPPQLWIPCVSSLFFIASTVRWFVQYLLCRSNYYKLKTIFLRHSVTKGCYIPDG